MCKKEKLVDGWVGLAILLVAMGLTWAATKTSTEESWMEEAVKKGHAEWRQEISGGKSWHWKTDGCAEH